MLSRMTVLEWIQTFLDYLTAVPSGLWAFLAALLALLGIAYQLRAHSRREARQRLSEAANNGEEKAEADRLRLLMSVAHREAKTAIDEKQRAADIAAKACHALGDELVLLRTKFAQAVRGNFELQPFSEPEYSNKVANGLRGTGGSFCFRS